LLDEPVNSKKDELSNAEKIALILSEMAMQHSLPAIAELREVFVFLFVFFS
jgi:hypothetical protein